MIVAFLDLLGFSSLLQKNMETALDNLTAVNYSIETRIEDRQGRSYSSSSESKVDSFAEKWMLTGFEQMISFSDSLVVGGNNADLFISQLAHFVASLYIKRSEPFKKPISDIKSVYTDQNVDAIGNGVFCYHRASPVLFRGGVASGDQVVFFDGKGIRDTILCQSRNITGNTYLNAVKLEQSGKGPRLFCDQSVIEALSDNNVKDMIKKVEGKTDIFEIIWTMEGCTFPEKRLNTWENTYKSINTTMLPPAINLYRYYQNDRDLKEHYEELLKLVCCGIIKYAEVECDRANDAIDLINKELQNLIAIDISILDGFLN